MLPLSADDRRTMRRLRLAEGLESAVQRAHQSPWDLSAQVPVARESVLASEERLLWLAAALRSQSDLPGAGLRAVRALLTDGAGPLFLAERDLPAALGRLERHLGLALISPAPRENGAMAAHGRVLLRTQSHTFGAR